MPVDHRHFGVQEALAVFVDFNSRIEKIAIEHLRSIMLGKIFHPPLQQQNHPYASSGRFDKRMTKIKPRQKIGMGKNNLGFCPLDRTHIRRFNVTAMAEIVPHQECRAHPSTGKG